MDIAKESELDNLSCTGFSIRGYVLNVREKNFEKCSPFTSSKKRLIEDYSDALPPIKVPRYRYWECSKCTAESPHMLDIKKKTTVTETFVDNSTKVCASKKIESKPSKQQKNNIIEPQDQRGKLYTDDSTQTDVSFKNQESFNNIIKPQDQRGKLYTDDNIQTDVSFNNEKSFNKYQNNGVLPPENRALCQKINEIYSRNKKSYGVQETDRLELAENQRAFSADLLHFTKKDLDQNIATVKMDTQPKVQPIKTNDAAKGNHRSNTSIIEENELNLKEKEMKDQRKCDVNCADAKMDKQMLHPITSTCDVMMEDNSRKITESTILLSNVPGKKLLSGNGSVAEENKSLLHQDLHIDGKNSSTHEKAESLQFQSVESDHSHIAKDMEIDTMNLTGVSDLGKHHGEVIPKSSNKQDLSSSNPVNMHKDCQVEQEFPWSDVVKESRIEQLYALNDSAVSGMQIEGLSQQLISEINSSFFKNPISQNTLQLQKHASTKATDGGVCKSSNNLKYNKSQDPLLQHLGNASIGSWNSWRPRSHKEDHHQYARKGEHQNQTLADEKSESVILVPDSDEEGNVPKKAKDCVPNVHGGDNEPYKSRFISDIVGTVSQRQGNWRSKLSIMSRKSKLTPKFRIKDWQRFRKTKAKLKGKYSGYKIGFKTKKVRSSRKVFKKVSHSTKNINSKKVGTPDKIEETNKLEECVPAEIVVTSGSEDDFETEEHDLLTQLARYLASKSEHLLDRNNSVLQVNKLSGTGKQAPCFKDDKRTDGQAMVDLVTPDNSDSENVDKSSKCFMDGVLFPGNNKNEGKRAEANYKVVQRGVSKNVDGMHRTPNAHQKFVSAAVKPAEISVKEKTNPTDIYLANKAIRQATDGFFSTSQLKNSVSVNQKHILESCNVTRSASNGPAKDAPPGIGPSSCSVRPMSVRGSVHRSPQTAARPETLIRNSEISGKLNSGMSEFLKTDGAKKCQNLNLSIGCSDNREQCLSPNLLRKEVVGAAMTNIIDLQSQPCKKPVVSNAGPTPLDDKSHSTMLSARTFSNTCLEKQCDHQKLRAHNAPTSKCLESLSAHISSHKGQPSKSSDACLEKQLEHQKLRGNNAPPPKCPERLSTNISNHKGQPSKSSEKHIFLSPEFFDLGKYELQAYIKERMKQYSSKGESKKTSTITPENCREKESQNNAARPGLEKCKDKELQNNAAKIAPENPRDKDLQNNAAIVAPENTRDEELQINAGKIAPENPRDKELQNNSPKIAPENYKDKELQNNAAKVASLCCKSKESESVPREYPGSKLKKPDPNMREANHGGQIREQHPKLSSFMETGKRACLPSQSIDTDQKSKCNDAEISKMARKIITSPRGDTSRHCLQKKGTTESNGSQKDIPGHSKSATQPFSTFHNTIQRHASTNVASNNTTPPVALGYPVAFEFSRIFPNIPYPRSDIPNPSIPTMGQKPSIQSIKRGSATQASEGPPKKKQKMTTSHVNTACGPTAIHNSIRTGNQSMPESTSYPVLKNNLMKPTEHHQLPVGRNFTGEDAGTGRPKSESKTVQGSSSSAARNNCQGNLKVQCQTGKMKNDMLPSTSTNVCIAKTTTCSSKTMLVNAPSQVTQSESKTAPGTSSLMPRNNQQDKSTGVCQIDKMTNGMLPLTTANTCIAKTATCSNNLVLAIAPSQLMQLKSRTVPGTSTSTPRKQQEDKSKGQCHTDKMKNDMLPSTAATACIGKTTTCSNSTVLVNASLQVTQSESKTVAGISYSTLRNNQHDKYKGQCHIDKMKNNILPLTAANMCRAKTTTCSNNSVLANAPSQVMKITKDDHVYLNKKSVAGSNSVKNQLCNNVIQAPSGNLPPISAPQSARLNSEIKPCLQNNKHTFVSLANSAVADLSFKSPPIQSNTPHVYKRRSSQN